MTLRFPKMHIADSVVNRILNASDEIEVAVAPAMPPSIPADPAEQGAVIDEALQTPVAPMPEQTPNPGATVQGENLIDNLLTPEDS